MNFNTPQGKRKLLLIVSAVDMVLSGFLLLNHLGWLPIGLSGFNSSNQLLGILLWLWFISALGIFVYQLTKPEDYE